MHDMLFSWGDSDTQTIIQLSGVMLEDPAEGDIVLGSIYDLKFGQVYMIWLYLFIP